MKKTLTLAMITLICHITMAQSEFVPRYMIIGEIEPCNPVKTLQVHNASETCVVHLTWEDPNRTFVTDGDALVSYYIFFNGILIGNTTKLTYIHTVTESGHNYFCVQAIYDTCVSESACKGVYTPCATPCPAVSNLTATQRDNIVLLEWKAAEGNPAGYYVYNGMGDVATVANTEYVFENLAPDEYIFGVEAVFGNGCEPVMVSINFIVEEVGIDETGMSDLIFIYPNPTCGILKIKNEEMKIKNVEIYEIYGKKLLSYTFQVPHEFTLDISDLQTGVYFMRIQTENGVITKKIIKQ
ncbi:MAG: T9SS type A sorting domain-containing protein [Bacteroidetes bacterium]|nr:T9SS type A sorting domain-containing protein [Bacteroidota bacterium]MCL2302744.1 T9SS type A sorting domain-containing protein [Lentimicrobiaceae bacterium]